MAYSEHQSFCDRVVRCTLLPAKHLRWSEDLSSSALLICLGDKLSELELQEIVSWLCHTQPLTVCFWGDDAEILFDRLLIQLDLEKRITPLIPFFSKSAIEECIEEFFYGSFPPEERFDNWQEYRIYIQGKDTMGVCEAVSRFLA